MNLSVDTADEGMRLDRYLRRQIGSIGQANLEKALRAGKIRINGSKQKASYRLLPADDISIDPYVVKQFQETSPAQQDSSDGFATSQEAHAFLSRIELQRSEDWIVYNKPSGLAVQGGSKTLRHLDGYLQALDGVRPKLVHRIDKDTSGLLLVARHDKAARVLAQDFKSQQITKSYLAVVVGDPGPSGLIDAPLLKMGTQDRQKMVVDPDGAASKTAFIRLDTAASKFSLLALKPITGRTHQLRAHMAHLGCPILGDGKYGGSEAHLGNQRNKLHLHAHFIQLANAQILTAPLPDHINNTIIQMGFENAVPQAIPKFATDIN